MEALALAVLPLALEFIKGESLAAILSGLTAQQWIGIGFDLANLVNPNLTAQLKAKLSSLNIAALDAFIKDIESGKDVEAAAELLRGFFAANPPPTIPGYSADGSVTSIRNPNFKGD